ERALRGVFGEGRRRGGARPRAPGGRGGIPLHTAGDHVRIHLRLKSEVGDHVTHLPALAGTGDAPGCGREGGEVLREALRLRDDELDRVFRCVHIFALLSLSTFIRTILCARRYSLWGGKGIARHKISHSTRFLRNKNAALPARAQKTPLTLS